MHLTRALAPLIDRELDVRRALRSRAAALHRVVADKKSDGNQAWRSYHERAFSAEEEARAAMADTSAKLYETASPLLQRLRDADSQLGLTDAEIRAAMEDAGFGKTELDTLWRDGCRRNGTAPVCRRACPAPPSSRREAAAEAAWPDAPALRTARWGVAWWCDECAGWRGSRATLMRRA